MRLSKKEDAKIYQESTMKHKLHFYRLYIYIHIYVCVCEYALFICIIYIWASVVAQMVKNSPAIQEILVQFLGREVPLEKGQATHFSILGLPCKESACNEGGLGSIPGLGRSPGGRHGNPLQDSCLENLHGQKGLAVQSMESQRAGHD